MSMNLVTLLYLVASVCFIQALKGLSHPTTSIRGNMFGMAGMAIAVLTTGALIYEQSSAPLESLVYVFVALLFGGAAGTVMAKRVEMTKMPELVAFRRHCIAKGCPVYMVRIDGCMYGLKSEQRPGTYLKKAWTILTTDPTFGSACGRCCQRRNHLHTVIMGRDTKYSGFYPRAMGKAIARHWDPLTHV